MRTKEIKNRCDEPRPVNKRDLLKNGKMSVLTISGSEGKRLVYPKVISFGNRMWLKRLVFFRK